MMKKTYFHRISTLATAVLISIVFSGCAAIYRQRGLSPQIDKKQTDSNFKLNYEYQWKFSKYGAEGINIDPTDQPISFQVYTNASDQQVLTIGPAIFFIVLPVIPWPPGIYHAITKRSADTAIPNDLIVSLNVRGKYEEIKLQIDFSNIDIEIDPPMETKGYWQVEHWTSQTSSENEPVHGITTVMPDRYTFSLTLPSISNTIRRLKIKLNDVRVSGAKIEMPPIIFEKGTGYGLEVMGN